MYSNHKQFKDIVHNSIPVCTFETTTCHSVKDTYGTPGEFLRRKEYKGKDCMLQVFGGVVVEEGGQIVLPHKGRISLGHAVEACNVEAYEQCVSEFFSSVDDFGKEAIAIHSNVLPAFKAACSTSTIETTINSGYQIVVQEVTPDGGVHELAPESSVYILTSGEGEKSYNGSYRTKCVSCIGNTHISRSLHPTGYDVAFQVSDFAHSDDAVTVGLHESNSSSFTEVDKDAWYLAPSYTTFYSEDLNGDLPGVDVARALVESSVSLFGSTVANTVARRLTPVGLEDAGDVKFARREGYSNETWGFDHSDFYPEGSTGSAYNEATKEEVKSWVDNALGGASGSLNAGFNPFFIPNFKVTFSSVWADGETSPSKHRVRLEISDTISYYYRTNRSNSEDNTVTKTHGFLHTLGPAKYGLKQIDVTIPPFPIEYGYIEGSTNAEWLLDLYECDDPENYLDYSDQVVINKLPEFSLVKSYSLFSVNSKAEQGQMEDQGGSSGNVGKTNEVKLVLKPNRIYALATTIVVRDAWKVKLFKAVENNTNHQYSFTCRSRFSVTVMRDVEESETQTQVEMIY